MTKKVTTEDFIRRAKQKHGNRYDYSLVNYTKAKEYVTIICSTHREFPQTPDSHLHGAGCPGCARDILGFSKRLTLDEFKERSKKIHGDIYDYSNITEYNGQINSVTIKCKVHDTFFTQTFKEHLRGKTGCEKCINDKKKQTSIERYGVDNPLKSKEIQDKAKQTLNERYGVDNPLKSKEIREKVEDTNLKRLGFRNALSSPEVQKKRKETIIKNFGYDHQMKNPDFFRKHCNTIFKYRTYIAPSGKEYKLQSLGEEKCFIELIIKFGEDDIVQNQTEVPKINWFDNEGIAHRYYCDFYIKSIKTIVEVKSPWTEEKDIEKIIKTREEALRNGFNYLFMSYKGVKANKIKNELYTCKGPIHFISYSIKE